jgi:NitT/TauT family transport system ATP-binding protein
MDGAQPAISPASGGARILVRGLGKRYGALQVFRDVDMEIGDREIVAIVGPSGCGKTTLLRCIDGLIAPSSGRVTISGTEVTAPLPGVAMVFQQFGLFPWKTVFNNVAYGLRLAGASKAEIRERVPRFVKLVGLAGFENAYPYQLSGGMQQRCGLARALAIEPSVLLMDEPFAAVDAQTRERLQTELLRIVEGVEGASTTVMFVTHSIEEAVYLGSRVIVMSSAPGRIVRDMQVDLGAERWARDVRLENDFEDYVHDARRALQEGTAYERR